MIRACFLVLGLIFFISCGNNEEMPAGILKPDKMQAVLWDVIQAEAFTEQFIKKDSSKDAVKENLKMQQEIFAVHHITKELFYKSYDYYKTNGTELKKILDSIIVQDDRKKNTKIEPLQVE